MSAPSHVIDEIPQSEAGFQRVVIDLAHLYGWRVAHFRPARTATGWTTPVAGDGKGWPDLVLVHAEWRRVLFVELKTDTGKLTVAQRDWLNWLILAGQVVEVWRPRDWDGIVRTLRGDE